MQYKPIIAVSAVLGALYGCATDYSKYDAYCDNHVVSFMKDGYLEKIVKSTCYEKHKIQKVEPIVPKIQ